MFLGDRRSKPELLQVKSVITLKGVFRVSLQSKEEWIRLSAVVLCWLQGRWEIARAQCQESLATRERLLEESDLWIFNSTLIMSTVTITTVTITTVTITTVTITRGTTRRRRR
jgi:hypothetical protein